MERELRWFLAFLIVEKLIVGTLIVLGLAGVLR